MHHDTHMDETWTPSRVVASDNRRRSSRIRAVSSASSDNAPSANSSQKRASPSNERPPRKRPQRKRATRATIDDELSTEEGMKPLSLEERMNWEGWVDLESDPALFNYILREYGVEGVKIQEVFSLDDEMLAILPQPVYGLIFLFRYRATDDHDDEEGEIQVPGDIWFANQTINNACATVAMLNIVMNAPDIDLGNTLAEFKANTQELEPAYRGKSLGENEFIRNRHNSFARKVDVHNVDLSDNDFAKWQKTMVMSTKKNKPASNNRKKKKKTAATEEPPFHFVAYVPINAQVWRFDGLQYQPLNLGQSNGNWISVARQHIEKRMAQYEEDGVEFNLLSLCESPLLSIPKNLAIAIKLMKRVEGQLDYVKLDWREFTQSEASIGQPDDSYGLTKEIMDKVRLPGAMIESIANAEGSLTDLMDLHHQLSQEIAQLKGSYIEEVATISNENAQAAIRMVPDTTLIHGTGALPEHECQDTITETKDKSTQNFSSIHMPEVQRNGEPQAQADSKALQETSQNPQDEAHIDISNYGADAKKPSRESQPVENTTATTHTSTNVSKEVRDIPAEGVSNRSVAEVEKAQTVGGITNKVNTDIVGKNIQNLEGAEGRTTASSTGVGTITKENENTANGKGGDIPKRDTSKGVSNGTSATWQADASGLTDTANLLKVESTT